MTIAYSLAEIKKDMAGMSAQDEIRRLKEGWARSDHMLRRVYNKLGPKQKSRVFPSGKYAAMTRKQIDELWIFPDRHLMHSIAKTLEEDKP